MAMGDTSIKTSTNFYPTAALPLDERTVVNTEAELDGISTKYAGLIVYVRENGYYMGYNGRTWQRVDNDSLVVDITGMTSSNFEGYQFRLDRYDNGYNHTAIPRNITVIGDGDYVSRPLIWAPAFDHNPDDGTEFAITNLATNSVFFGTASTSTGEPDYVIAIGETLVLKFNASNSTFSEAARYSMLTSEEKEKLKNIKDGATKVEDSSTNGNIKIDGTEVNVYTHPTNDGNKHVPATGTTNNGKFLQAGSSAGSLSWVTVSKDTVGLGNVDNTSDTDKPVSTAQQQAINAAKTEVKEYADGLIAANDRMRFIGVISSDDDFKDIIQAEEYEAGWAWRFSSAIKSTSDGYIAWNVEVNDLLMCIKDCDGQLGTGAGHAVTDYFTVIQTNIDGAVTSQSTSSTDGYVPVFSGTTGKLVKTSNAPKVPTATEGTDSDVAASTAFVEDATHYSDEDGASTTLLTAHGSLPVGYDLDGKDWKEILKDMLLYTKPVISITGKIGGTTQASGTVYKLGTTQNIEFTVNVTKKSDNITSVKIYKGSTATSLAAQSGSQTHTLALTADTTVKAECSDGKNTVSASLTYYFVNPMYIGAVASAPTTAAEITALSEEVVRKTSKMSFKRTFETDSTKGRYCFVYPSSYGKIASVKDKNGFDNTGAWGEPTTVPDVNGVSYYAYTYGVDNFDASMEFTFTFAN